MPSNFPYQDISLSIEARTRDLLGRMTTAEKAAQLTAVWLTLDPDGGDFAPYQNQLAMSLEQMEPALSQGIGHISRPLGSKPIAPRKGAVAINAFQKRMVEGTRLGIPAFVHEECLTGVTTEGATQFPSPLNYGSTWNPALIRQVGECIRGHLRSIGIHQGLGPVADVVRDARWGRAEECMAEDPLLVGAMVTAYVQGLQGDDPKTGVVATLKHFCAYSGSEGGRNMAPTHVGPREVRDIYLPPFEMAVRLGGALSLMNGYQEIDGVPCAANRWLLTEVLRGEWGFEGTVVADYWSVVMLMSLHGVAQDAAEASAKALNAGLDQELPLPHCYWQGIPEALERGLLTMQTLDLSVSRVLRQKFRLGLFENPYADADKVEVASDSARALSAQVAAESLVLLKNTHSILPLSTSTLGTLAVIGPNADDPWAVFGNYSYHNHVASHFPDQPPPDLPPSLLDELRERIGADRILHAGGCRIQEKAFPAVQMQRRANGLFAEMENISHDRSGIAAAVASAQAADTVLLVLGDKAGHFRTGSVGEGTDADDLRLPGVQDELAKAVLAVGKPTVVVLIAGRAPVLEGIADKAAAVVLAWFPGPHGAQAIANLLLGQAEPSGRLSVSLPRSTGAMPFAYNHRFMARGVPSQPMFDPAFAFGHGLSYTTFEWSEFALSADSMAIDGSVEICTTVRNTGNRPGCEVVQLYARDPVASVTRPVLELKGFARLELAAGAAARVRFILHAEVLAFTGPDAQQRIVEPGSIVLSVGASCQDIRGSGSMVLTGAARVVSRQQHFLAEAEIQVL